MRNLFLSLFLIFCTTISFAEKEDYTSQPKDKATIESTSKESTDDALMESTGQWVRVRTCYFDEYGHLIRCTEWEYVYRDVLPEVIITSND